LLETLFRSLLVLIRNHIVISCVAITSKNTRLIVALIDSMSVRGQEIYMY
jgi:hypothetical protein